jgi:hypothetical protein
VAGSPYSYAVLQVVPRVDRDERLNVGVVVFCRPLQFLGARTQLDEPRLSALWPDLDIGALRTHLEAVERIAAGDESSGPIAKLDLTERWHWLVAPSSTILQPGAVHTGLCGDPVEQLARLYAALVLAGPAA